MSATRSVNPVLSADQKAAVATRYAAGEPLAALVKEFRTWTLNAKWAIHTAGHSLRSEDNEPNLCRVCGELCRSATRRRLCAAHVRSFCSKCDAPLAAGRVNPWCTTCEAAHKQRLWAKQGRTCTTCGEPAVLHSCQCAACQRETYEFERAASLHVQRPCVRCGETMPAGRRSIRCTECQRNRLLQQRRERRRQGQHRCRQCGEALGLRKQTYCGGCQTMIANWRRDYHRGNEIARRLGHVQQYRRWQERASQ